MVDLRLSEEDALKEYPSPTEQPVYPYGLCISLCQDELEKLGYDVMEFTVGDMLHLHCMASVTSKTETQHGSHSRIELQITHISAESEDEENEEADKPTVEKKISKLYNVR